MTVLGVFIVVAGLTSGLILGLQYYFSCDLAEIAAENSFRTVSEKIGERIKALDSQSTNLVGMLSNFCELEKFSGPDQMHRSLPLLEGSMNQNPNIYAIYMGYNSGEFFELVNLESNDNVRKAYGAAPHDRWVVINISIVNGLREKTTLYMDSAFKVRTDTRNVAAYDPRKRPWFTQAIASPGIIKTAPYIFSNLKMPGVTYARSINGGQLVIGVDISLANLSNYLEKQQVLPHSQAFMYDKKGDIIAQTLHKKTPQHQKKTDTITLTDAETAFIESNPVIRASNEIDWPPFDFALSGKPKGYSVDLLNLLSEKIGLRIEYINGYSWEGLMELFNKGDLDLLHSLLKNPEREKLGIFTTRYLPMPQAFVVKAGTLFPASVADLKGKTVAIPKGWATDIYMEKHLPDVTRLHVASTLDALRLVSAGDAYATFDSEFVLRYLTTFYFFNDLRIGGHPPELSGEGDQGLHFLVHPKKAVLASILDKALAEVTQEEQTRLDDKWFGHGGLEDIDPIYSGTVPHRLFLDLTSSVGAEGALRPMNIKDRNYYGYVARIESVYGSNEFLGLLVPVQETLQPYMDKVRFSFLVTIGFLLLLAPIVWYCSTIIVKPINALALESMKVKQRRYNDVGLVKSNISEIFSLSRSMVSMATAIKEYEESLKELMDSFIKLIATAIDHKSPYTGGHCARVPELAIMLARVVNDSTDSPFSDFSFQTDDEWREFRTAAWLHDCGKVTTPEYIVDKATKLETIYNRIHEVRMRFEVLLRDAEIDYWRGVAHGGNGKTDLAQTLTAKRREIEDDFAFIAECNVGGEFMDKDKIERMRKIAGKTWMRNLNDRLGLGHLELMRYPQESPTLPCEEPLLADRQEHIIKRPKEKTLGRADSGFKMEVPRYLYNLGEIYNLSIPQGTLSSEDRYKINEHATTTIRMLEILPYPKNMTKIPGYAGAHHETLIGTGYPRKLVAKDIGIPARIIAVSDVFEALTASDRPYKRAKTLSEAVRILSIMVKDKHLDADIFKLFLESGVYMEYAKQFLDPSQIDDVDIMKYVEQLE